MKEFRARVYRDGDDTVIVGQIGDLTKEVIVTQTMDDSSLYSEVGWQLAEMYKELLRADRLKSGRVINRYFNVSERA